MGGVEKGQSETFEFFLNYKQYKVGISAKCFFLFISFIKTFILTHKFDGKYCTIF